MLTTLGIYAQSPTNTSDLSKVPTLQGKPLSCPQEKCKLTGFLPTLASAGFCPHMHLSSNIPSVNCTHMTTAPLASVGTHTHIPTVPLWPLHSPTLLCILHLSGLSGHQHSGDAYILYAMPPYVCCTHLHSHAHCTSLASLDPCTRTPNGCLHCSAIFTDMSTNHIRSWISATFPCPRPYWHLEARAPTFSLLLSAL